MFVRILIFTLVVAAVVVVVLLLIWFLFIYSDDYSRESLAMAGCTGNMIRLLT